MAKVFMSTLPKSGTHFLVEFFQNIGLKRHIVQDETYRILIHLPYLHEINQDNIDLFLSAVIIAKYIAG